MRASSDSPSVLVFPPVLFGDTLLVGLLLYWAWPVRLLPTWGARVLGLVVLLLSGWLVRSAEAAMKRVGTDPRPDHPSVAVVTDGPFRWTRNPMYLGTTGLYLGITLLAMAPSAAPAAASSAVLGGRAPRGALSGGEVWGALPDVPSASESVGVRFAGSGKFPSNLTSGGSNCGRCASSLSPSG